VYRVTMVAARFAWIYALVCNRQPARPDRSLFLFYTQLELDSVSLPDGIHLHGVCCIGEVLYHFDQSSDL
jgi:hypothetical protein